MLLGLTEPEIKARGAYRVKQHAVEKRHRLNALLCKMAFRGARSHSAQLRFSKVLHTYARAVSVDAVKTTVETCLGEQRAEVANG